MSLAGEGGVEEPSPGLGQVRVELELPGVGSPVLRCVWLMVTNSSQPGRLCWNDKAACQTEIWASVQTVIFFFPHRLETSFKIKALTLLFILLSCKLLQVTFKLKVATLGDF